MVHKLLIYFVFRCLSLRHGSNVAIGVEQNRFHRFIQNESISHHGSDSNVLRFGPVVYVGEIQCKNGISLEKIQNFQNEATDFYFVLFY